MRKRKYVFLIIAIAVLIVLLSVSLFVINPVLDQKKQEPKATPNSSSFPSPSLVTITGEIQLDSSFFIELGTPLEGGGSHYYLQDQQSGIKYYLLNGDGTFFSGLDSPQIGWTGDNSSGKQFQVSGFVSAGMYRCVNLTNSGPNGLQLLNTLTIVNGTEIS